ncbi:substrate-binding domain-containing protein [Vallitalea guaymasensis]|uniref:substrate-binding domain-containing protein n=1 Tax=Vallitalea guaymasensis TaxID=1185412 RepID=UPI000DE4F205|nr:substrate-binding domain-containing protein [Vallitalea guaymasensis]
MKRLKFSYHILILIPIIIIAFFIINSLTSKSSKDPQIDYLIGMSHPNLSEEWQILVNEQMKNEAEKIDNLSVIFTNAGSSTYKQVKDINMLMDYGIDLLIITVNDANVLGPLISEINKKIPVIVLDRDVSNYDFTLYIGPDYYSLGKKAGERVVSLLGKDGGKVIEVRGPIEEPSVVELSHGFDYIINQHPNINILTSISSEWLTSQTEERMNRLLKKINDFDIVFAHNNAMALGAYYASKTEDLDIKLIGVSGLMSNKYRAYLEEGILDTTFLCPIGGKESIDYAIDILNGENDIPRKIILNTIPITKENMNGIESDPIKRESIKLGYIDSYTSDSFNLETTYTAFEKEKIELIYRNINSNLSIKQQHGEQLEAIKKLIDNDVDMIAISPVVSSGWDKVLNLAKQKNIPVIFLNNMVNSKENLWTTYVGSDYYDQGKLAASYLVNNVYNMKNDIVIAEIRGHNKSASTIQRTEGFNQVINGYSRINVKYRVDTDLSFEEAYKQMKRILGDDKVNVVFTHEEDISYGALKAIKDHGLTIGKDIIMVTTCNSVDISMNNHDISCLVQSYPVTQSQLIKVVRDYMNGISPKKVINKDKLVIEDK